jgi:hypothetical protein
MFVRILGVNTWLLITSEIMTRVLSLIVLAQNLLKMYNLFAEF